MRVPTGPANPGKYLKFSLAFSSTACRMSFKMVLEGSGKSCKSVNMGYKAFLKDL